MKISINNSKVVIFFGGPSNERNISLDSARTFYDSIRHYLCPKNLTLVFISKTEEFYFLSPEWIYSNTINDFEDLFSDSKKDFLNKVGKEILAKNLKSISAKSIMFRAGYKLSSRGLNHLIDSADGLFPLIHGTFGEDGKLTSILQKRGRKAILGSSPEVLYRSFKKNLSHLRLKSLGYKICKYTLIKKIEWVRSPGKVIDQIKNYYSFQRKLDVVIKPNDCGSSDGVSMVFESGKIEEAVDHAFLFSDEVLIEERILGKEFSVILIDDKFPLALFPTEIVLKKRNQKDAFYSRQKKYMPGSGVEHITPANFSKELIEKIRRESETIFQKFGFSDWARFDGFLLSDGSVIWSDLNSIPGIGQDGLLFQQSIYLGIDTFSLCRFILSKVLKKEGKIIKDSPKHQTQLKKIGILGGGSSSEKQVSRMSWCNVIEKLDRLQTYQLKYFFMDKQNRIWSVPRPYTLKHTTGEIEKLIKNSSKKNSFPSYETVYRKVRQIFPDVKRQNFFPQEFSLPDIKEQVNYLFSCLHGGIGENGFLQKKCEKLGLLFNGSGSKVSRLTFDKTKNSQLLESLADTHNRISMPKQVSFDLLLIKDKLKQQGWGQKKIQTWASIILSLADDPEKLKRVISNQSFQNFASIVNRCVKEQIKDSGSHNPQMSHHRTILKVTKWDQWKKGKKIIKPATDGCSTGVVVCHDIVFHFPIYLLFNFSRYRYLPTVLFDKKRQLVNSQNRNVEKLIRLPNAGINKLICEEFLNTRNNFIELTVGVVGRQGEMVSLLPSKTVAEKQILSLDEKFNKGVGPNLTPPRELNSKQIEVIRHSVASLANCIGLKDYARLDIFYHLYKEKIYLIEVNTLPGLTAATILFTQALVTPELKAPPSEFLEQIIEFSLYPRSRPVSII